MNTDEFNKLIDQHESCLMRYAYRLLGGHDYTDDAVQEAFISFYSSRLKREIANPKAWLFKAVRNKCIDFMRKNNRSCSLDDQTLDVVNNNTPDKMVMAIEKMQWVKESFAELNDREREALTLKIEHLQSYKQIAEIMDISTNYVGYIIHEAMNKLKNKVKARGEK